MGDEKKKQLPLYSRPYRGKPRFFTEGLLRDSDDEATTATNYQIMWDNSELIGFHESPFPDHSTGKFITSPSTSHSNISPLSSPSSIESILFKMPSTELEISTQKVVKQIQHLIAYVIFELLFVKKTMTSKDKTKMMYENYHGVENKPHVLHNAYLFIRGKGKFESVMEKSDDGHLHLMKHVCHNEKYDFIVSELPIELIGRADSKVITLSCIKTKSIKSDIPFSARSVQTHAETTVKNCKLAVAFGKKFIDADGNLPSGWSDENYYDKVLDLMYEKISNDAKKDTEADGEEGAGVANKRPPRWVFNGFMAFVC